MKKISVALTFAAVMSVSLLLSGCMKRGEILESVAAENPVLAGGQDKPDVALHDNVVLDFDEVQAGAEELILDSEEYPLSSYIDTYADEDRKQIMLIWPLQNEATEEDGVHYAEGLLRAYNDAAHDQDFSIALSTEDSYGGLYSRYDVNVQVFREQDLLNAQNYFVSMTIPAGSKEKVVKFSEYDGVNKVFLIDGASWIPGGKYTGGSEKIQALMAEDEAAEESAAAARAARGEISEFPGGR